VRLAAVGATIGLCIAIALASGLKAFLFGIGPTDPWTLAAMATLILIITLVTCWIPARRAARIEPLVALRNE